MTVERWTDEMLDKLAEAVAHNTAAIDRNAAAIDKNAAAIDKNAAAIDKNAAAIDKNAAAIERNAAAIERNAAAIDKLTEDSKELNIRFTAYQQASQWVVNLAFGLLATATITTIISAVVRK